MSPSAPRRVHHIDVVVRDLEDAVRRYRRVLGIEPLPRESLPDRGVSLARFRVGETWLILVQPIRDDSPVARFLEQHGEGFFHMAIEVEDVVERARELTAAGVALTNEQPRRGVEGWKLVDVEVRETLGAMIQLVEPPEE